MKEIKIREKLRKMTENLRLWRKPAPEDEPVEEPDCVELFEEEEPCLMGPPCYLPFLQIVRWMLPAIAVGTAVLLAVLQLLVPEDPGTVILSWLAAVTEGWTHSIVVLGCLFSMLYDSIHAAELSGEEIRDKEERFTPESCRLRLWLGIGIPMVILCAAELLSAATVENLFFRAVAVRESMGNFALLWIFSAVKAGVRLLEGDYTPRLVRTTVGCNVLATLLLGTWLRGSGGVNPAFRAHVLRQLGGVGIGAWVLTYAEQILLAAVVIALAAEAAVLWNRSRKTGETE